MKAWRAIVLLLAIIALTPPVFSQEDKVSPEARQRDEAAVQDALQGWWKAALPGRDQRLAWFRDAKFGCFIHWGVYADPAGEYKGRVGRLCLLDRIRSAQSFVSLHSSQRRARCLCVPNVPDRSQVFVDRQCKLRSSRPRKCQARRRVDS